ncbi:MAG: MFS transporter [Brevundimonas sp.]
MHSAAYMPDDVNGGSLSRRAPGILLALLACLPIAGTLLVAQILPQMEAAFPQTQNVRLLVSLALTAPALAIALSSWIAGWLADRVGHRRLLLGALVAYAILGLAPFILNDLGHIILARAGMGVAEGFIMTCSTALIGDLYSGRIREGLLSLQTAIASIAAVIFAVIGGLLGEAGWRTPFAVYGIALVFLPLVFLIVPAGQAAGRRAQEAIAKTRFPVSALSWICLSTLLFSFGFYVAQIQLPYLVNGVGVTSPGAVGGTSAIANTAVVLGALTFAALRRLPLAVVGGLCFVCLAAGLGLAAVARTYPLLCAGLALASFGGGIALPTFLNAVMKRLEPAQRGVGTGLWQSSFWTGQFLSPVLMVPLTVAAGGLTSAVMLVAIACAALTVLLPLALRMGVRAA